MSCYVFFNEPSLSGLNCVTICFLWILNFLLFWLICDRISKQLALTIRLIIWKRVQVMMKDFITAVPVDEMRNVAKKCLEKAALINYTKTSEMAKVEGNCNTVVTIVESILRLYIVYDNRRLSFCLIVVVDFSSRNEVLIKPDYILFNCSHQLIM